MRAPLYIQLFSLLLLSLGLWFFFNDLEGVKRDQVAPVPFADWAIKPRSEDDEDT